MRRSRGFSFAEVMFAVVILGVGFIMVASIFPVAAVQTRATNDQAIAAQLARDAVNTIQSSTTSDDYDDFTGHVVPFAAKKNLWDAVGSSMICKVDRRYACVPFYSRASALSPVCLTVLVVRRQLHEMYTDIDEDAATSELVPRGVNIAIRYLSNGTNLVDVARNPSLDPMGYSASVAPGCYLVVTSADGSTTGHALQIGELQNETADLDTWTLAPSCNLSDESCSANSNGVVIGRDFINASNESAGYSGTAQDISVFKTFLH